MTNFLETILNGKKIDLTNKEEHDEFVENIKKLKSEGGSSFFNMFGLGDMINKEVDNLVKYADKIYDEGKLLEDSTPASEEEEEVVEEPIRPSDSLTDEMYDKIDDLVNTYLDTMIMPSYNMDSKQYNDVHDGLLEFAAWIYTH